MDKKIKENLKNAFDDGESISEFWKTDIGKSSRVFLIVGIIMAVVGYVIFAIILNNNLPEDTAILLAMIVSMSMLGATFVGLYAGQGRYYNLTKKNRRNKNR